MRIFTFFVTIVAVAMRGSHVTTIAGRFCGAIAKGGFGNELFTGRQTQDNILYFFLFIFSLYADAKFRFSSFLLYNTRRGIFIIFLSHFLL